MKKDQGIKVVRKYIQIASSGLRTEEKETINVYITFLLAKGRNPHHQHNICPDEELEMLMTCHIFYLSPGMIQKGCGRMTIRAEKRASIRKAEQL